MDRPNNIKSVMAYAEMAKLRIVTMVLVTTTIGYLLGSTDRLSVVGLLFT